MIATSFVTLVSLFVLCFCAVASAAMSADEKAQAAWGYILSIQNDERINLYNNRLLAAELQLQLDRVDEESTNIMIAKGRVTELVERLEYGIDAAQDEINRIASSVYPEHDISFVDLWMECQMRLDASKFSAFYPSNAIHLAR